MGSNLRERKGEVSEKREDGVDVTQGSAGRNDREGVAELSLAMFTARGRSFTF